MKKSKFSIENALIFLVSGAAGFGASALAYGQVRKSITPAGSTTPPADDVKTIGAAAAPAAIGGYVAANYKKYAMPAAGFALGSAIAAGLVVAKKFPEVRGYADALLNGDAPGTVRLDPQQAASVRALLQAVRNQQTVTVGGGQADPLSGGVQTFAPASGMVRELMGDPADPLK